MASIISAGTTSGTSLNLSGDTSGVLQLATNGSTTAVTVDTSQRVGIGTSTTTDAGVTITTNVTRDGTWNAKLALQSTGSGNYPGLFFTGCSGSTRYSVIAQTASTSGDDFKQTTHQIMFVNNSSTSGDIRFDINGNVGTTNPTERMRINSNGNIALQGATLNASGVGITFPATQSASSDANCLDDYEEGTYTATLTPATSGSITIDNSYKTLSYVKIGRAVHVTGYLYIASVSSPTGANVVLNLPFNVANGEQFQSSASISTNQLGSSKAANTTWNFVQLNDNKCLMYDGSINGVGSGAYATYIQAGTDFRVQITYFTS